MSRRFAALAIRMPVSCSSPEVAAPSHVEPEASSPPAYEFVAAAPESDEARLERIFRTSSATGTSGRVEIWRVSDEDALWLREHHPAIRIRSIRRVSDKTY